MTRTKSDTAAGRHKTTPIAYAITPAHTDRKSLYMIASSEDKTDVSGHIEKTERGSHGMYDPLEYLTLVDSVPAER